LINALYAKKVPTSAKTTYNVGVIEGGTTVNSICGECSMLYEYRSENRECLAEMEAFFNDTIRAHRDMGMDIEVEVLGIRPCTGDVDSEKLAAEIDKRSRAAGRVMDILVEINSGREENKSGVMPEDVEALCEKLANYPNIRLCGFMTMAPRCESSDEYRKYFSETYNLIVDIWEKKLHNIKRPIISMGMSESFHEAIAEGSSCVRVGRAFFAR